MKGIVLIAGLPATGKTTLANALLDCAPPHLKITKWTLDEMPNVGLLKDKNDRLFNQVTQEASTDIHIIDDTFHLQSMRKRYLLHCRHNGHGFAFILLQERLNILMARNAARVGSVTDQDIVKMDLTFEYEGHPFYRVQYDAEMQVLWTRLLTKLEEASALHVEALLIPPSVPTQHSSLHTLNILLNRAVGYILKGSVNREQLAGKMKGVKSEILDNKKLNGPSPKEMEALQRMDHMHFVPLLEGMLQSMYNAHDDTYK